MTTKREPKDLIAKRLGFSEREYFEVEDTARGPVNVSFASPAPAAPPVAPPTSTPPTPPTSTPPTA